MDEYTATRLADYAAIQAGISGMPQPPLRYRIRHLFLNGNWFPGMQNVTVLNQMTDLIHNTGASYLAVNVGPGPWLSNNTSQMGVFGQAITYAKSRGLAIELYPTFPGDRATVQACAAVNGHALRTVADWTRCMTTPHSCWKVEATYMQTFAKIAGLNWMGIDVYSDEASAMSTYLQMIQSDTSRGAGGLMGWAVSKTAGSWV